MGKWGTLAVTSLVLLIYVLMSRGMLSDQLDIGEEQSLASGQDIDQGERWEEDPPVRKDETGTFEGHEWRRIAEGNNTTVEIPWWVYAIMVVVLAGGAVGIVASSLWYRRKRREAKEKSLRVSEEWEGQTKGSRRLEGLFMFGVPLLVSFALTLRIAVEVEWEFSYVILLFTTILVLATAPFLYLFTLRVPRDIGRTWKKTDRPFDEVIAGINGALESREIPYRRLTPGEYSEKGSNERIRRIEGRGSPTEGNAFNYDLEHDDQVIIVREWERDSKKRVNVIIFYRKGRDDDMLVGLKKRIDGEIWGSDGG
jgi:hypothetical protein